MALSRVASGKRPEGLPWWDQWKTLEGGTQPHPELLRNCSGTAPGTGENAADSSQLQIALRPVENAAGPGQTGSEI